MFSKGSSCGRWTGYCWTSSLRWPATQSWHMLCTLVFLRRSDRIGRLCRIIGRFGQASDSRRQIPPPQQHVPNMPYYYAQSGAWHLYVRLVFPLAHSALSKGSSLAYQLGTHGLSLMGWLAMSRHDLLRHTDTIERSSAGKYMFQINMLEGIQMYLRLLVSLCLRSRRLNIEQL